MFYRYNQHRREHLLDRVNMKSQRQRDDVNEFTRIETKIETKMYIYTYGLFTYKQSRDIYNKKESTDNPVWMHALIVSMTMWRDTEGS